MSKTTTKTQTAGSKPADFIKSTFSTERIICRIIAAWCCFATYVLYSRTTEEQTFSDLSFAQDIPTSKVLLWVILGFAVFSGVFYLFSRFARSFETDTWFMLAGATLCVIKWLADFNNTKNSVLFLLAVIAAYAFFVVYFVAKNTTLFDAITLSRPVLIVIIGVLGLVGCYLIAAITVLRYKTFASPNFDFGLFVNMFHYMKTKGIPLITCERNVLLNHFVVHISPIYYTILPFYFIFPSPVTLQIAQAVVLISGIVPVYFLCKKVGLGNKTTAIICFIYAFYPALATGCFYDIHENCFLTPLLLWLFYFHEADKPIPMAVFAVLTLMVKEDAAVYVILFALYVLLTADKRKKKIWSGVGLLVGSAGWFLIAMSILSKNSEYWAQYYKELGAYANPSISGPMINRFNNLIADSEDGILGAVKTAILNPGYLLTQLFTTKSSYWEKSATFNWDKIVYTLQLVLPLGFLPFASKKPHRWLLLTPILMNLLTYYQYQYNINFQYQFGITAFLFYAAILNVSTISLPSKRVLVSVAAAACVCLSVVLVLPKYKSYSDKWEQSRDTYVRMDEILENEIPDDASVCCSSFLLAHIADRDEIYELNYHGDIADCEYVVYDNRSGNYRTNEHIKAYMDKGYTVVFEEKGTVVILKQPEAQS